MEQGGTHRKVGGWIHERTETILTAEQREKEAQAKSSSNGDHEDAAHCKPSVDSVFKSQ